MRQLILLLAVAGICYGFQDDKKRNIGLFTVVKFNNEECTATNDKLGTCYTEEECEQKGGTPSGSCAEGYGVCCVFTMNCGGSMAENLTYFESNSQLTGVCSSKICKSSSDICQLRMDFVSFVIAGPSTETEETHEILAGSSAEGGESVTDTSVCKTDSFTVTGSVTRGGSPVICGTNSGQHLYVDAAGDCNTMSFYLGESGNSISRQWEIRVTQYKCDSLNKAPDSCLQYYYGSPSGYLETFNWANKMHLAGQMQLMCIRQELGMCRICYSHGEADFGISHSSPDSGYVGSVESCCGYYYEGTYPSVFDCIIIRGPSTKTNSAPLTQANGHFCGENLVTDTGTTVATICSKLTPFQVRFLSDLGEERGEAADERGSQGFKLYYEQFSC